MSSMWQPTSREEQQSLADMAQDAYVSMSRRFGGQEKEPHYRRVPCPGDFPKGSLDAQLAADMIYGIEHEGAAALGSEELVARLAAAQDDERRRRVVEALALREMKQAAFNANGLVAAVALGSGVKSPAATVELDAQSTDELDWRDGYSYQGFLGPDAYQRALTKALPEATQAVLDFLASLKPETGMRYVYDAIRDATFPAYYKAYAGEYLASLQAEGDDCLERAARLAGDPDRYLQQIDDLRLRLPDDTYRLVDVLEPQMLMATAGRDRWRSSGPPSSLGEILAVISEALKDQRWQEARQAATTLAAERQQQDPRYRDLVDAERHGHGRSATELVAASLAAEDDPPALVLPTEPPRVSQRSSKRDKPLLPCWLTGGHDFAWLEPRKEWGLWHVKKRCSKCSLELDYQIGTSSEDGHRWSAAGGSAPPPKRYWALNASSQNPVPFRKQASEVVGGTLLLGMLAAIPLGLILVVAMLFLGLSQGIAMSQRPQVVGALRPGLTAHADHGAWRWQKQRFVFFTDQGEPYGVRDSQWGYRWQVCQHGGCHDVGRGPDYTVQPQDTGKYLRVVVSIGPPPGKMLYKAVKPAASAPRLVKGAG